ncbi:MAG: polysaccharide biosynthesis/export family protein [Omnitrophica bacterium]|nr:polysaccharide biosynthesis/export family protein [Candidatus Omnitrophota bacterium]
MLEISANYKRLLACVVVFFFAAGGSVAYTSESSRPVNVEYAAARLQKMSEGEKLYRYFGVASGLRKEGRLEEAVEILGYILEKNPGDDYVKSYLKRAEKEMQRHKAKWKTDSKKDAAYLKEEKIKGLALDGSNYYKAGDYDKSLLQFVNVLSLDSKNQTAKHYMEKLKRYYAQELKMENIARSFITGKKETDVVSENAADMEELKYIALNKRADSLLKQAELGFKIDGIVAAEKAREERSREFTLGPGDIVQMSVLDHPELSGEVTVLLSGEIKLPLVNDIVMAKDLTIDELTEKVTQAMGRYVQKARVNILPIEYKSKTFYVIDELTCTPYPITRPDFTLRDALFTSDWGDNRALGRVVVMKPSERRPVIKKVDAFDIIYRGNLKNNMRIQDGDVIYVPMTFMAKVTKTVADTLGPFRAMRQARDNYLNLRWNRHDWKGVLRLPKDYDTQPEDGKDVNLENLSLRDYIVSR